MMLVNSYGRWWNSPGALTSQTTITRGHIDNDISNSGDFSPSRCIGGEGMSFPDPKPSRCLKLTLEDAIAQYQNGLITAAGLLYFAIKIYQSSGQKLRSEDVKELAEKIGLSPRTFYKAKAHLVKTGHLEDKGIRNSFERQVRDRLQAQLGGVTEVTTPSGRIDLLTASEVIEVKHLSEWKSAMGQVLAYSGFYPEHCKRIHLFGKSDEAVICPVKAICLEFDITVTFEEAE